MVRCKVAVGCAAQVREVEELAQIQRQQHASIVSVGDHIRRFMWKLCGDLTISSGGGPHGRSDIGFGM